MERCRCIHRLAVFSCLLLFSSAVANAALRPGTSQNAVQLSAQDLPQPSRIADPHAAASENSNPRKTEEFTLSHERYEKAVAYSRAGYTLYFVSFFLTAIVLIALLRLGVAARFR